MGTKLEELALLADGKGCLGKAADDEPVFILRAQDAIAPNMVGLWAEAVAIARGDTPKVAEARSLKQRMLDWQAAHHERVKVPD